MSTDLVIARLDAARLALSEARTIQDTKKILDVAEAAKIYARRQQLGEESIAFAQEVIIEALRQLGEFAKAMPKNAGARGVGKSGVPNRNPTLAEQGIDKKTSMTAQRLADLSPEKYEQVKSGQISLAKATAKPKPDTPPADRKPETPGPSKPETGQGDDDAIDNEILAQQERLILEQQAQIESLSKTDQSAEIISLVRRLKDAERARDDAMNNAADFKRELDKYGKWFGELRRVTKLEQKHEITAFCKRAMTEAA